MKKAHKKTEGSKADSAEMRMMKAQGRTKPAPKPLMDHMDMMSPKSKGKTK